MNDDECIKNLAKIGLKPRSPDSSNQAEGLPDIESLGEEIQGYSGIDYLGRGGMGTVYLARQESLDRQVAIKFMPENLGHDELFRERFKREALAMSKLNHPNIVQVYDFGETLQGHLYIVMEYADGPHLGELINNKDLDQASCLQIVREICDALQYAHDKGFMHRDIKPSNIFLNSESRIKIGDFGLAKLIAGEAGQEETGLTMTGTAVGTPHYIAPEQMIEGESVDHRADLYSLGVLFYQMLTSQLPIGNFPTPSSVAPVDKRLDNLVLRTLDNDLEYRFQSAQDVSREVAIIQENSQGEPAHVSAEVTLEDAAKSSGVGNWVVWGVVLLLSAAAIAVWLLKDSLPINKVKMAKQGWVSITPANTEGKWVIYPTDLRAGAFTMDSESGVFRCNGRNANTMSFLSDEEEGQLPEGDFELTAEVKTTAGADGGIYLFGDQIGQWPEGGFELQINDGEQEKFRTGAIHKTYPPVNAPEGLHRNREWMTLRLVVKQGESITSFVDGFQAARSNSFKGFSNPALGLQSRMGVVEYRNIRWRPLPSNDQ